MKHSNSVSHLKKFVYVDSSEDEQDHPQREEAGLTVKRECVAGRTQGGSDEAYRREMKELIQAEIDKIEGGNIMLVAADDREV
jgi:hypothetical protein